MSTFTAHILGPRGSSRRINILADDLQHAIELTCAHTAGLFGSGFSFTVREVAG